MSRIPTPKF